MRIVPYPGRSDVDPEESWLSELEAALSGEGEGPVADSWRELREDVRALAPPIAPEFERELTERLLERGARSAPKPHRRVNWLRSRGRLGTAAGIAAISAVIVVFIAGPWRAGPRPIEAVRPQRAVSSNPGLSTPTGAVRADKGAAAANSASAPISSTASTPSGAASTPARVQQLGASVSLTATPTDVQVIADRVARLAVSDGGYVQNSHVQVQQAGASEASLMLSLPSARLSAALASLAGLAPVRAESQSLQDITNTYDAARKRLSDATAERRALLSALSRATTQGQIDSLREQLSGARGAIAHARSALQAVSQRASTAEVEVTVVGDAKAASEGLTLHRGLHDAGRVLVVTLAVLLIAAAILVPLALLLVALVTARRAWRRYWRERVLDAG